MKELREIKDDKLNDFDDMDSIELLPDQWVNAFDPIFENEEDIFKLGVVTDLGKKTSDNILCCCQKDKSHDETMKFILMNRPDQTDIKIFDSREQGQLIHLNDTTYANQMANIYDSSILIGRNFDI